MKTGDNIVYNNQNSEYLRSCGKNSEGDEIAEIRIDNRQFFVQETKISAQGQQKQADRQPNKTKQPDPVTE